MVPKRCAKRSAVKTVTFDFVFFPTFMEKGDLNDTTTVPFVLLFITTNNYNTGQSTKVNLFSAEFF